MQRCQILITTSPITAHPSTDHIDNTIAQIRKYLPDPILILCDGQSTPQYEEYKKRLEWKRTNEWQSVAVWQFTEPCQQSRMVRKALELTESQNVFFCEHDTYPTGSIDFDGIFKALEGDDINLIRLFHYPAVHPDHRFMYGAVDNTHSVPLMKTIQFSSRTYLCKTTWFRQVMNKYFQPNEFTFIEERLEPITRLGGWGEWENWKMWVYAPKGDMVRSGHSYGKKLE